MEPFMDLATDPSWDTFQRHLMAAEQRTRERAQELHIALMDIFELQEENRQLRQRVAELEYRLGNHGQIPHSGACAIRVEFDCDFHAGENGSDLSRSDW